MVSQAAAGGTAVSVGAGLTAVLLVAKILAGMVALSLVIGGVVLAGKLGNRENTQHPDQDSNYTETQETQLPEHYDLDVDGTCDLCYAIA